MIPAFPLERNEKAHADTEQQGREPFPGPSAVPGTQVTPDFQQNELNPGTNLQSDDKQGTSGLISKCSDE